MSKLKKTLSEFRLTNQGHLSILTNIKLFVEALLND